jgi:phage-related protein
MDRPVQGRVDGVPRSGNEGNGPRPALGANRRQTGGKADNAKPLHGFGGAGVLEIVEDYAGDTFRAVYTLKLAGTVYVLHCFQKKSKRGSETPKQTISLIKQRLKTATETHERHKRSESYEEKN